jgi:pyrroloquinoline quinone biosynthesis protein B
MVLGIAQDGGSRTSDAGRSSAWRPGRSRETAPRGLARSRGYHRQEAVLDRCHAGFEAQVAQLGGLPDAILLTHAHIGHYLGLAQLGREVVNAAEMPVFCTPPMAASSAKQPVEAPRDSRNIAIHEIEPDREFALTDSLRITALRVPHRTKIPTTVAYLVAGPSRRLLWLPDIDNGRNGIERSKTSSATRTSPFWTERFLRQTRFRADRSRRSRTRSCRRRSPAWRSFQARRTESSSFT